MWRGRGSVMRIDRTPPPLLLRQMGDIVIDPKKVGYNGSLVTLGCNACGVVFPELENGARARNARALHLGEKQTVSGVAVCPRLNTPGYKKADKAEYGARAVPLLRTPHALTP